MSIEAMISEHPQVGAGYNETLGHAIKDTIDCAAICNSCADACVAEPMNMRQCMDCADICTITARVAMRRCLSRGAGRPQPGGSRRDVSAPGPINRRFRRPCAAFPAS